jgi:hypothetical protein
LHSQPKSSELGDFADFEIPPAPLKQRLWFRVGVSLAMLMVFGLVRMPFESRLNTEYRQAFFHVEHLNLDLRQQVGQSAFLAALGGFRAPVADYYWIQLHIDWQHTEWGKMLGIINTVTALQPRNLLFWEMSAWHMAYNASASALNDRTQPREALRLKHQHEYFLIGKDILERGIANNPDKYKLYEELGNILSYKLRDHAGAAQNYGKASTFPDCATYLKRFALYETAQVPGHEREAYEGMLKLYNKGDPDRLPTLCLWLNYLQDFLKIPASERVNIPQKYLPRVDRVTPTSIPPESPDLSR